MNIAINLKPPITAQKMQWVVAVSLFATATNALITAAAAIIAVQVAAVNS